GGFGKTSRRFWKRLRAGGVEVRCYNAPTPASPLGWLSRDHRKMLGVDGTVGFVSGLCVGQAWVGDPARDIAPWRDTGVEVRGPAVRQIEAAFAQMWALMGEPLPDESMAAEATGPVGETALRVVATVPNTAGLVRVGQLGSALSRKRLWLTDAYYAGTPVYLQALRSAARGGGSAGRAAAGLLRIGNTVSAAVTNKRKLEPVETRIMLAVAVILVIVGVLVAIFPRLIAYPMAAVAIWIATALLYRTYRLRRKASSP